MRGHAGGWSGQATQIGEAGVTPHPIAPGQRPGTSPGRRARSPSPARGEGSRCPLHRPELSALAPKTPCLSTLARASAPSSAPASKPPLQSPPVPSQGKGARPCELVAAGADGAGVRGLKQRGTASRALAPRHKDHARVTHDVQGIGHARGRPSRRGPMYWQGVKSVAGPGASCRGTARPTAPGKPCARGVRSSSKRYFYLLSGRGPVRPARPSHPVRSGRAMRRVHRPAVATH